MATETPVVLPPHGLAGSLIAPDHPKGIVVFAHGSGSSRLSPRNRQVALALVDAGMATLLFDLLTEAEAQDRANVFDIRLLAMRLVAAIDWIRAQPDLADLPLGLFGASTGAAAALGAAAMRPESVAAVVSRGGRPDLAGEALQRVTAPTLLIVGGDDEPVLTWNRQAQQLLAGPSRLEVVPGASHLFEEPGALAEVVHLAAAWFAQHLVGQRPRGTVHETGGL
jgi:putative phosphoribosyl transferase